MMLRILGLAVAICASSAFATEPFLSISLDEAMARAEQDNKPVLAYLFDPGKAQCNTYRELTWIKAEVGQWLGEHVHAIQMDISNDATMQKRFDIRFVPAVVVLTPTGTVRASIVGFRDSTTLISELTTKLQASDPVGLARKWADQNNDSPAALLLYARALEEAGRTDEALKYYLRCFDHNAPSTAGFGGMQLVVLEELGRLSRSSEKAEDAIVKRRDETRQRLLLGQGERSDPSILASANGWLDDFDDTYQTYVALAKEQPESLMTRLLRESTVETARELRLYERIEKLIDPAIYAKRAYDQFQSDLRRTVPSGADEGEFRTLTRKAFVDRSVRYYEMLIGAGRNVQAETLASMLISVDQSHDTFIALARAGLRTQRPTLANAEQARRALRSGEHVDPEAVATLVRISLSLGHLDEARRVLNAYLPEITNASRRESLLGLIPPSETP